ncbi:MAG: glycosyltransferase [Actinomycetota bacterium]|nr:glycosyltransferase [Actinomycetota bacterium]
MPQPVNTGEIPLEMYERILPEEIAKLRQLAGDLKGARVLHINSTPYGGGVSELLRSQVPFERALGIDANWQVISGEPSFFRVTKAFHNALQGGAHSLTRADQEIYLAYSSLNAKDLKGDYDFIIVHDPQPAAIRSLRPDINAHWIWRCHVDTSNPNPEVWDFLVDYVNAYDAAVFTLREFKPYGIKIRVETITPAIDPLSPKNMELPDEMISHLVNWTGVSDDSPLICQVSRFDVWKDPLGVIEAYRLVKQEIPNVNLALVGSMALDDPEGWDMYEKLLEASRKDEQIHIYTNVGDLQVNAFQRLSDVVIQKSIREGFGLVVSETLWKGTPVVAGKAGGIPIQMAGGGGFLVESIEETAKRVLELLSNPVMAAEEGKRGKEHVRKNFLITRLIKDELMLLESLVYKFSSISVEDSGKSA